MEHQQGGSRSGLNYERISVCSHVNAPPSVFKDRLPAKFRDRAPKIVHRKHEKYGDIEMVAFEGREIPFNLTTANAGIASEDVVPIGKTFQDGLRGAWDPAARLLDQDRDGVDAEVITHGPLMLATPDRELKAALIRAQNDWLAEFCAHSPQRLVGVACLPVWDSALSIAEAERTRKLGMRGGLIPSVPGFETPYSMPAKHQYNHSFWDPLWSALESLDMPAHIHTDLAPLAREFPSGEHHVSAIDGRTDKPPEDHSIILMTVNKTMLSEPITVFCCTGVFERHPKLKLVTVESGVGWMAYVVPLMDLVFERHRHYTGYALKEKPSFYFSRQVYGTYIQDVHGVRARDMIGVEHILWSNDYPHLDGIWPNSSASIEEHMAGVPAQDRHAILAGNAVRLYGL
jgi:predicted TIM-barrel fold metal-dependent hydrolase